jgi:hypothetical protein
VNPEYAKEYWHSAKDCLQGVSANERNLNGDLDRHRDASDLQSGTSRIAVRTLPRFSQLSQHMPVMIATVAAISTPAMA